MLSVARERPLDPMTLQILWHVDRVAREIELDYLVVGATARDIVLNGIFGLYAGRATGDVDLAVVVAGWPQFEAIKARLVGMDVFVPDEKIAHRLYYRTVLGERGYPLDLIPFGGVERLENEIAWPPDGSIVMSVAGYSEALASAVRVEVEPGLVVRVASLPGLAILKLVAWADRGTRDPRDAIDLATLLHRYAAAGNEDRLYGPELGALEAVNYDLDLAGPRLLGLDAGRIAAAATRREILALLDDPARMDRLVLDVARGLSGAEDSLSAARELLVQFRAGLQEA